MQRRRRICFLGSADTCCAAPEAPGFLRFSRLRDSACTGSALVRQLLEGQNGVMGMSEWADGEGANGGGRGNEGSERGRLI